MGFWHTGYLDLLGINQYFEVTNGTKNGFFGPPPPPTFQCSQCGVFFASASDLSVHAFQGHSMRRPILVFRGRECGQTRLLVTSMTSPTDWVIAETRDVYFDDAKVSATKAMSLLSNAREGVHEVRLLGDSVTRIFEFEFARAEIDDLEGVDIALVNLMRGTELSSEAIFDFTRKVDRFRTARRYSAALANYFYGVLQREHPDAPRTHTESRGGFEAKFDQAVSVLARFDRPPAEAICGLVAFHYNQFSLAMTKTRSRRVAEASLRFQQLLLGQNFDRSDLGDLMHPSLDSGLSDLVSERVLVQCSIALDGSAPTVAGQVAGGVLGLSGSDVFKLQMLAAEHYLAQGKFQVSSREASGLRDSRAAEVWFGDFTRRVQKAAAQ